MKTTLISRVSAFAISVVFATVATVGIAMMMTAGAEQSAAGFAASAAVQPGLLPAASGQNL